MVTIVPPNFIARLAVTNNAGKLFFGFEQRQVIGRIQLKDLRGNNSRTCGETNLCGVFDPVTDASVSEIAIENLLDESAGQENYHV